MGPSKKSLNRPKKRTLVRWDGVYPLPSPTTWSLVGNIFWRHYSGKEPLTALENLNELLLLTVQSVCNTQSVKIPWAEVAKTMGNNVTEGAIVQHLAKLRSRRAATGKDVPPPLRRGGIGAATKPAKSGTGSKRKPPRSPSGSDGESSVPFECDDDSDEDYNEKRRTKRKPKQAKRSVSKSINQKSVSSSIKQESDSGDEGQKEGGASSEELLVPGADFLDFPNDMSEDSSGESTPGPTSMSKIVVLKFMHRKEHYRELVARFEEISALILTEAGGVDYEYHTTMPSVNPGPNIPDLPHLPDIDHPLLYQHFETMPGGAYMSPDSITYGNPLQNNHGLPIGMMDHSEFYPDEGYPSHFQDFLGPEGNLDFS